MEFIIFILLVIIGVLVFPERFLYTFVKNVIPIRGDGEYAMDNFEMTVLLLKALICAVGVGAVITLFRTR